MSNKNSGETYCLRKLFDRGYEHVVTFTTFGNFVRVEHVYNSRKLCKQTLKKKQARELWARMKNFAYYKDL